MKKIILTHVLLTILALLICTAIALFSLKSIANAEDDYCPMWEKCADDVYGGGDIFDKINDDEDIIHEKKESRIDRLNKASRDNDFELSNTSSNKDKTIGQTVLRGLENR